MRFAVRRLTRGVPGTARRRACLACLALVATGVLASSVTRAQAQVGGRRFAPGETHQTNQGHSRGRSLTIRPFQDHDARSNTVPGSPESQAAEQHYYGVLGAVNRPEVYVTSDRQLTLVALIAAARGLSGDASEIVSVIRNGRSGLKFRYSPESAERLLPGDVVVVNRVSRGRPSNPSSQPLRVAGHDAVGEPTHQMRAVAFVGLVDDRPIIVSVDPSLPQLIDSLYQPVDLIRSVRVIRADYSDAGAAFDPQTDPLINGDVIVFDPARIDRWGLARVRRHPSAIPIEAVSVASPERLLLATDTPEIDDSAPSPEPPLSLDAPENPPTADNTETLPGRTEFQLPTIAPRSRPGLPAPALPEPARTDVVIDGPGLPTITGPAPAEAIPNPPLPSESITLPTDLSEVLAAPVSMAEEQPMTDPIPLPTLAPFAPASAEPQLAELQPARSFGPTEAAIDLVALQTDPVSSPPFQDAAPRVPVAGSHVPKPAERSDEAVLVGIGVLVVAVLCVVASLFWFRIDENSGRTGTKQAHESTSTPPTGGRRTLNRLIANSLPVIEEQISLPERVAFHGEAVGRRRIRIDAQHDAAGPHFSSAADAQHAPVVPAGAAMDDHGGEPATGQSVRIDSAQQHPSSSVVENAPHGPKPNTQNGLLERVLVAMEREKRR